MARQKTAKKVLGFLNSAAPNDLKQPLAAFHRGLKQAGYVERRNLDVKYLWAKHDLARLPDLARRLARGGVDVVAATGGLAAAQAGVENIKDVPVVFVGGFDPVEAGLVNDLKRPSGNATGISTSTTESLPQRLERLKQLAPGARIALLIKPNTFVAKVERERADGSLILEASNENELKRHFAAAKKDGLAIAVGADAFFTANRKKIVALAKQHNVPVVYPFREYVDAGGLMSYGPSLTNAYRQAGLYVGKLLDDPHRKDLPVLSPNCFELVVNLKAAKGLGREVPYALVAHANHVID